MAFFQLTADNTDVPFTVSLARPSGVDIVVTGENTASFTASFQVQNVELESHTVGAGVDADATTAQVTRIEIDPMHGPDTVGDAYTVTVNSTDFTHVVTQSDLDSTDPTATVLGALETLIEADTGLGLTVDLSSSGHVNYRPDDTNTASAPASAAGLTQVAGETVTFTSTPNVYEVVSTNAVLPSGNMLFHPERQGYRWRGSATSDGSGITTWTDLSGNNSNATASQGTPGFEMGGMAANGGIQFSSGNAMTIANTSGINESSYTQKSFAFAFETGSSVSGDQVIYEQGGGTRGYSLSIAPDASTGEPKLYAFTWNEAEWPSGHHHKAIDLGVVTPNSSFSVAMVHDATDGNGTFTAFLNGQQAGQLSGVPMQHPHGGEVGIGVVNNDAVHPVSHAGMTSGSGSFSGTISEVMSWNAALSSGDIDQLTQHMADEWGTAGGANTKFVELADYDGSSYTYTYREVSEQQTPEGPVWGFVNGGQVINESNWSWTATTSVFEQQYAHC